MSELVLSGLDGSNPLGFLAALGALRSLEAQGEPARLSFRSLGWWRPVLHDCGDLDRVLALLDAERLAWRDELAVRYSFVDDKGREQQEIKPPPAAWRETLQQALATGSRRSLDQLAAYASELVTDNNGNTKPTALHFAAGQQRFLNVATELLDGVTPDMLREALVGPAVDRPFKSFSWDASVSRDYALRASDPSSDKKLSQPGAEWLAFLGLSAFPVFPRSGPWGLRLRTTGCTGGWKTGCLRWPLWTAPASGVTAASVISTFDHTALDATRRRARGIAIAFQCDIRRSDQGGYGTFNPAQVI